MSMHFSANQFEHAFAPKRLGNWEVPKWFPERPRRRSRETRVVADDRGHLLPGVRRLHQHPPPVTAWDYPRTITRQLAREVAEGKKPASRTEGPRGEAAEQRAARGEVEVLRTARSEAAKRAPGEEQRGEEERPEGTPAEELGCAGAREAIVPEPPAGHQGGGGGGEDLVVGGCSMGEEGVAAGGPGSGPNTAAEAPASGAQGRRGLPVLASAYTPFLVAKQCAEENLRHQPLPDTVADPSYQLMESQGAKHPGASLPGPPRATAVSVRHKHPGPTHCTKSSIFRTIKPPAENALSSLAPLRAKAEEKVTKALKITDMDLAIGWDIYAPIKADRSHQILGSAPSVFNIVPPPSPPIGGNCGMPEGCGTPSATPPSPPSPTQNGIERAPCSSKQTSPPQTKPPTPPSLIHKSPPSRQSGSKPPTPLTTTSNNNGKPTTPQSQTSRPLSRSRVSVNSWDFGRCPPPPRKAWEEKENDSPNLGYQSPHVNQFLGNEVRQCLSGNSSTPQVAKVSRSRQRRSHSSPNLTRNATMGSNAGAAFHKTCSACNETPKATSSQKNSAESSSYKMAFKAGKPNNSRPMTAHPAEGSGSASTMSEGAKVKVPKPRAPYARRSYSISTLAPPFSLWPGNHKRGAREYPDHWRLASVYQHAFKPIPSRKRPLLSTVYQ